MLDRQFQKHQATGRALDDNEQNADQTRLDTLQEACGGPCNLAIHLAAWPLGVSATIDTIRRVKRRRSCKQQTQWWRLKEHRRPQSTRLLRKLRGYDAQDLGTTRTVLIESLAKKPCLSFVENKWTLTEYGLALFALLNEHEPTREVVACLNLPEQSELRSRRFRPKWESSARDCRARSEAVAYLVRNHDGPASFIRRLCAIPVPVSLMATIFGIAFNLGCPASVSEWLDEVMDAGFLARNSSIQFKDDESGPINLLEDELGSESIASPTPQNDTTGISGPHDAQARRIPDWKLTCTVRHVVGGLIGSRNILSPRWWDPLDNPVRGTNADRFSRWWCLIRSSSTFSQHLAAGLVRPATHNDAAHSNAHPFRNSLGDGRLVSALQNSKIRLPLLRVLGGLCGPLTPAVAPESSRAWWDPPSRALPVLAEAWRRAETTPWLRAVLAFGELPRTVWDVPCTETDVDRLCLRPESQFVLGGGAGQLLLLHLAAENANSAATIIANVVRSGMEAKDASAACCVAAIVVAILEGPTAWKDIHNFDVRRLFPAALAIVLSAGDRDPDDDASLYSAPSWSPSQFAAWCACALASMNESDAAANAAKVEERLRTLLPVEESEAWRGVDSILDRMLKGGKSPILEATGLSLRSQAALVDEIRRLKESCGQIVPEIASTRAVVGSMLSRDDGEVGVRPALLVLLSTAVRFASRGVMWTNEHTSDCGSSHFAAVASAQGGLVVQETNAAAWRAVGELFVAASTLLRYVDTGVLELALPIISWGLEMFCDSMNAVRRRVHAVEQAAIVALQSQAHRDSTDLSRIYSASRACETSILGICARSQNTARASLELMEPRGRILASTLPSFSTFVLSSRLLRCIAQFCTANNRAPMASSDSIDKARRAAIWVVSNSLFGAETACCAWLTQLGGTDESLSNGSLYAGRVAAETRMGCSATSPGAGFHTFFATVRARAALGLSGICWRSCKWTSFVALASEADTQTAVFCEENSDVSTCPPADSWTLQKLQHKRQVKSYSLRRHLHDVHYAAMNDAETRKAILSTLPCLATVRLALPRPTAYGHRPWHVLGDEDWCQKASDDQLDLAHADGEYLGRAVSQMIVDANQLIESHCARQLSSEHDTTVQSALSIEAACIGVCTYPDAVRPSAVVFSPTAQEAAGGTGCPLDSKIFQTSYASVALPAIGLAFRNRLNFVEQVATARFPFSCTEGCFQKMSSVAVRRFAKQGNPGALSELRWRSLWTYFIVGPSESMRQAATSALFADAGGLCQQRIREWLGHLLHDACRSGSLRNPSTKMTGAGKKLEGTVDIGPKLADAAAASAVRRLLSAGAIISPEGEHEPVLSLACRSGRLLLAIALLEAGASIRASGGNRLIEDSRRARAFELAETLTLVVADKECTLAASNPAQLWPGADIDDMSHAATIEETASTNASTDDLQQHNDGHCDEDTDTDTPAWEWLPDTRAAVAQLIRAQCNVCIASQCILHHCIRFRLLDAAKTLLEHGADANQPDSNGLCCIHLACGMDIGSRPSCGFPRIRNGPSWQKALHKSCNSASTPAWAYRKISRCDHVSYNHTAQVK